ncbi:MAG: hypothetical protein AB7K68_11015 [Bacteriovoracia bacterium]
MKAIFRFLAVMAVIFGVAIVWKADRRKPIDLLSQTSGNKKKTDRPEETMQLAFTQPFRTPMVEGWSKEKFQADLEEAFSNEDPCAVHALLAQLKDAPPAQFWAAGMAALLARQRNRNPLLEELFAFEQSPLYGKPAENSRNPETRFFNSLLYSGMLTPVASLGPKPERYRNYDKAIGELRELAQQDPENGAYAYYLAESLKRSGAKKEEVQAAFIQAGKAARFNTYYQTAYDTLLSTSYDNAAAFTWVYSFLPTMAVPEFNTRSLKNWASENETGKWIAQKIAKKLSDIGTEYKQKSPGYYYSHVEYMVGQNLKHTLSGLVDKDREEFFKKTKEAQEYISEQPAAVTDAETAIYMSMIEERQSCSTESWRSLFETYRQKAKGHS